ncbi:hypothetical protein Tco_0004480 [Tanacetum coccineum]
MVLPDNPMGSPDNVLDNQIFETSSNDSHLSNVEMYLNDEEDDGDSIVILQTPSEEIKTRINNTRCLPLLLKETGEDKIWEKIRNPLSPNHIERGYSICCDNIIDMINSIKDYREENRAMFISISDAMKLMLAVATNMRYVVENYIGNE